MSYIYNSFSSLWNKNTQEPRKNIYEERSKCFQKLAEIQKNLQSADEEYINVSFHEGEPHKNAWSRMELYSKEYRKEYERCEQIMKM